ncbi:MAG: metallophosphoesterase family protein [Rectinemataceae bacterium]|nr:metallophosphoesterase family protein [Rectinemataceae bacterium]
MKKILMLSDIHGRGDMAARIIALHPDIDTILIAGDLTNFGSVDEAMAVRAKILSDGKPRSIYAVAGNCDPLPVRRYLKTEAMDVEGFVSHLAFGMVTGAGGGLKRAGLTSFERTEAELEAALRPHLALAKPQTVSARPPSDKPLIVLTHSPPYGTNADKHGEAHVGSHAFARMMLEFSPEVWISGHIHESRCVSLEDGTLVVNPGPCNAGCYGILEIQEGPGGKFSARAYLSR